MGIEASRVDPTEERGNAWTAAYLLRLGESHRFALELLRVVSDHFSSMGYKRRGDWLSGPCLYPEHHRHDDQHPSFGFNTRSAYGHCYICGSILLKDVCDILGIRPTDYGGLFHG